MKPNQATLYQLSAKPFDEEVFKTEAETLKWKVPLADILDKLRKSEALIPTVEALESKV